jgi:hypothetical protein
MAYATPHQLHTWQAQGAGDSYAPAHVTWRNAPHSWLHDDFQMWERDELDVRFLSYCLGRTGYYIEWHEYTADGGPVLSVPHAGGFMCMEPCDDGLLCEHLVQYVHYLRCRRVTMDTFVYNVAHCINSLHGSSPHSRVLAMLVRVLVALLADPDVAWWITGCPYAHPYPQLNGVLDLLQHAHHLQDEWSSVRVLDMADLFRATAVDD